MLNNFISEIKKKAPLLVATTACCLAVGGSIAYAQTATPATIQLDASTASVGATTDATTPTVAPTTTATPTTTSTDVVSLTAVPPRYGDDYSLALQPGQSTQIVLEIRNPTNNPVTVQSFGKDFIIGDDGETPIPVDEVDVSNRWSLASWLTITPNNTVIEPRKSASILVNINVPADAMAGGHYAMVLHKPVSSDGENGTTGSQISTQVGTLLYVLVEGDLVEDASVTDFAFTSFSENGPVPFSFNFNNDSSMHVRPEIYINVKNVFGKVVDKIDIDQKNVFPGAARNYTGEWNRVWGFGPYKAELTAHYGKEAQLMTSALSSFWIVPVRLIVAILIVIAIVIAIIVSIKRKYAKMLQVEENKVKKLDEKLKKAKEE